MKVTYFIAAIILVSSCINPIEENKFLKDGKRMNVFMPLNDEISNQDAQDYYDKGIRLIKEGKKIDANGMFIKADSIEQDNVSIINSQATNLYDINKKDLAIGLFERALILDPSYQKIYVNYSFLLNEENEYKKSVELLNKGFKYGQNDQVKAAFNFHLAIAYYNLDNCLKANEHLSKSFDLVSETEYKKMITEFRNLIEKRCR